MSSAVSPSLEQGPDEPMRLPAIDPERQARTIHLARRPVRPKGSSASRWEIIVASSQGRVLGLGTRRPEVNQTQAVAGADRDRRQPVQDRQRGHTNYR